MEYPLISTVADDLKNLLVGLTASDDPDAKLFKDTRKLCLNSYDHLFKFLPELSFFPAAIVVVAGGEYKDAATSRDLEAVIIVVDELRLTEDQAEASYSMLDAVSAALTGEGPGVPLEINAVHYSLRDVRSLELDNTHAAWVFTLSALASCQD